MKTEPKTYITISGLNAPLATTTKEARELRDSLVAETLATVKVRDPREAETAGAVLVHATELLRFIEVSRKRAKERPLQLCAQIDALAKELCGPLALQVDRIGNLLGSYQAEQNRLAEQLKREAWEKEERIREEANRKDREAADKSRKEQAELERKARAAKNEENAERYRAEAEKRRLADEAALLKRDDQVRDRIIETRQAVAVSAPVKQTGIATRPVMHFRLDDITKLYEAAPFLVRMEPNVSAIQQALKGLSPGQGLPGVTHWVEMESVVTSAGKR